MSTASCIYEGTIRHRRFTPRLREFRYRLFMMFLDLDEIPTLFRGRWFWSVQRLNLASFWRSDYLGKATPLLADAVRDLVDERLGWRPPGPIRLLTQLRYFGFLMNPISLYYCYDSEGKSVVAIVAEVTNTPWRERHYYVLDTHGQTPPRFVFQCDKELHVSPFLGMNYAYHWRVTSPSNRLAVHIENHHEDAIAFDATLLLKKSAITSWNLMRVLCAYPPMTWKVGAAIYWQALRLWQNRVPYFPHPNHSNSTTQ